MSFLPLRGADEAALRSALDRLTGEWSGEVQVKAMDDFVLKTIPATRRVSWTGDTLVSEITLTDGASDYVVVARQRILLGRLESTVSRPSQPEDRYLGEITGGVLVWTNAEGNRRDAREQVIERGGALVLETSSVEPIRALGLSGLVRMEGRFRRPQPEPASEAPVAVVASTGGADLETLRAQADEAERRAGAAESRVQALEATVAEAQSAQRRLSDDLETARRQISQLEGERTLADERLAAARSASDGAAREAAAGAEGRRQVETRVVALEADLAGARRDNEQLLSKLAAFEQAAQQAQRDNERLVATNQRLEVDRKDLERQIEELKQMVAESQTAQRRLNDDLESARRQISQLELERSVVDERLAAARSASDGAAREAAAGAEGRRQLEARVVALEADLAGARRDSEQLASKLASAEQAAQQAQRDNERLVATNQRLDVDRKGLEEQIAELKQKAAKVAATSIPAPAPAPVQRAEVEGTFSAGARDKLIAEVQQMERRVLELESERNTMREQMALAQRQLEETRRLRDDTLVRFQAVVSELNAMREEKERLARANVSLQSELRTAQQAARNAGAATAPGAAPAVVGPASPATTFDGKTADMVIAGLTIIGVTRGDGGEDKAILDGRVYRNGDIVEPQLGIVFVRIEDNSLVFQDKRGREYRRRF